MSTSALRLGAPRLAQITDDKSAPTEATPAAVPEKPSDQASMSKEALGTLAELMRSYERAAELERQIADHRFHVVVIQDRMEPRVIQVGSVPEVIQALAEVRKQRGARSFIFRGEAWGVTRGEFKYLVSPAKERFPLFDESTQVDIDPFGRLDAEVDEEPSDLPQS